MHIDCTTPQLQQSFNLICTFWLFSKAKHASSKAELRLLAQIFNNFSIPFLPHFIFYYYLGFFFLSLTSSPESMLSTRKLLWAIYFVFFFFPLFLTFKQV